MMRVPFPKSTEHAERQAGRKVVGPTPTASHDIEVCMQVSLVCVPSSNNEELPANDAIKHQVYTTSSLPHVYAVWSLWNDVAAPKLFWAPRSRHLSLAHLQIDLKCAGFPHTLQNSVRSLCPRKFCTPTARQEMMGSEGLQSCVLSVRSWRW